MKDAECVEFLQWALPQLRMRWPGFRKVRKQVCKRISRRMTALRIDNVAGYRAFLDSHADEWDVLDSFCRITISRFYRDRSVFDYLGRQILPSLAETVAETGENEVRCWCVGCASGEEVYTLKMVWRHNADRLPPGVELVIMATDIDPVMLERARRGCFPSGNLKELPELWREEDLERIGDEYCVRDYLREGVEFCQQDIRTERPTGSFHLILCRNLVFTYFEPDLQEKILRRMLEQLVPNGFLVAGKQEPVPAEATGLSEAAPHTGVYHTATA